MKIITRFRIESGDTTRLDHMDAAMRLVGGPAQMTEEQAKVFGRIRANEFGVSDVQQAFKIITERAAAMRHQADTSQVFTDAVLQRTWADGVRSSAHLAVRQAKQFMSDLRDDTTTAQGVPLE